MATDAVLIKLDGQKLTSSLQQAQEKLGEADGEVVLDFSSVRRIDPDAILALEKLTVLASEKGTTLGLRGVNVDLYKVLKLVRLAPRLSFLN